MIVPDSNLLLYAYTPTLPQHATAKQWWADALTAAKPVGLSHQTLFAFLHTSTNARLFKTALTITEAGHHVRSWVAQPHVQIIQPAADHLDLVLNLLHQVGAAGNLVADAHLAALAMEHHAVLHTADADFERFPNLRWYNPITGLGSETLRKRPRP